MACLAAAGPRELRALGTRIGQLKLRPSRQSSNAELGQAENLNSEKVVN